MSSNENDDVSNILNTSASPADDATNLKQKMIFLEKNVQRLNVDVRNLYNVIGLGNEKSIMEASNFMVGLEYDVELNNTETPKGNYFDISTSQGQSDQKESLNQNSFSTTENLKERDSATKRSNDSSSNDNNSNCQESNGQKENLNQNNASSTHKDGYDRTIVNESIIYPQISLLQENNERKIEILNIEKKIFTAVEELRGGGEEIRDQMEKANKVTKTRIDTLTEEMKKMNEEMKKMRGEMNQISVLSKNTIEMMKKIDEKLGLLPK